MQNTRFDNRKHEVTFKNFSHNNFSKSEAKSPGLLVKLDYKTGRLGKAEGENLLLRI